LSCEIDEGGQAMAGSSINVMAWARGHRNDWDFFASESGDPAWNIESVLDVHRRIEDWQGAPDATRCGSSKDNALPPIGEPELF
jgi:choline dehydrogenase